MQDRTATQQSEAPLGIDGELNVRTASLALGFSLKWFGCRSRIRRGLGFSKESTMEKDRTAEAGE